MCINSLDYNDVIVMPDDVEKAVKGPECNKSWGVDCLYVELLKYSSKCLYSLLCHIIIWILAHGIFPHSVLHVFLAQAIEERSGNISSKDNYKHIASASIWTQICWEATAEPLGNSLSTTPNQICFKQEHRMEHRLKA